MTNSMKTAINLFLHGKERLGSAGTAGKRREASGFWESWIRPARLAGVFTAVLMAAMGMVHSGEAQAQSPTIDFKSFPVRVTEGASFSFVVERDALPTPDAVFTVPVTISRPADAQGTLGISSGGQTLAASDSGEDLNIDVNIPLSSRESEPVVVALTGDIAASDIFYLDVGFTNTANFTAGTASSFQVGVVQTPVVSISAAGSVVEGSTAKVYVTATPPPSSGLQVSVNVTTDDDIRSSMSETLDVDIPANRSTAILDVSTVADTDSLEDMDEFMVEVRDVAGYDVPTAVEDRTATVKVLEDAPGTRHIVALDDYASPESAIDEGDSIFVALSTDSVNPISVYLNVEQSGGDFLENPGIIEVENMERDHNAFGDDGNAQGVTINTRSNGLADPANSSIIVTIVDTPEYRFAVDPATGQNAPVYGWAGGQGKRSLTFPVNNIDTAGAPEIGIELADSSVTGITEGADARFKLTVDPVPEGDGIRVNFEVDQIGTARYAVGHFLDVTVPSEVSDINSIIRSGHVAIIPLGSAKIRIDCSDLAAGGHCILSVPTVADEEDLEDDTIRVSLLSSRGAGRFDKPYNIDRNRNSAQVMVADDDVDGVPSISISASDSSVRERDPANQRTVTFTLESTNEGSATSIPVTVRISPEDSSFLSSGDLAKDDSPITLTRTAMQSGSVAFTLTIEDDNLPDDNHDITVVVMPDSMDPPRYTPGANPSVTVSVEDNDRRRISINGSDRTVAEGTDTEVPIAASPPLVSGDSSITVGLTTTESPIGCLNGSVPKTINIEYNVESKIRIANPANEFRQPVCTVAITVADGTGYLPNTISNQNQIVLTLTDDNDPAPAVPTFSVTSKEANEDAGTMVFTVTKIGEHTGNDVSVQYATSNGTAIAGSSVNYGRRDYDPESGMLSFSPAESSKTVSVTINNDNAFEGNIPETFNFTLSSASTGSAIASGGGTATGTIMDNDPPPTVSIERVSSGTMNEGDGGEDVRPNSFSFRTVLSHPSGVDASVPFEVAGTGTNQAVPGEDIEWNRTSRKEIPYGSLRHVFEVPIVGDIIVEEDETFQIAISDTESITFDFAGPLDDDLQHDTTPIGFTIRDDDEYPEATVSDVVAAESSGTMTFTVELDDETGADVTVAFAVDTADSTAAFASDYTAITGYDSNNNTGSIAIRPGERSGSIEVDLVSDSTAEATDETLVLDLTIANAVFKGETDGTPMTKTVTGTITETAPSAARPVVTIGQSGTVNAGSDAVFTITASHTPTSPTTVRYMVAESSGSMKDGPALGFLADGYDARLVREVDLDMTSSVTTTPFNVPTQDPLDDVEDGTITVTLLDGNTYTLGAPKTVDATVSDGTVTTPIGMFTVRSNLNFTNEFSESAVNPPMAIFATFTERPSSAPAFNWQAVARTGGSDNDTATADEDFVSNSPAAATLDVDAESLADCSGFGRSGPCYVGRAIIRDVLKDRNDNISEGDETFTIAITGLTNAYAESANATATDVKVKILDDEDVGIAVARNTFGSEASGEMIFNIGLRTALPNASTITVTDVTQAESGTATSGADYTAIPATAPGNAVSFAAGETGSKQFRVALAQDGDAPATDETIVLRLALSSDSDPSTTLATRDIVGHITKIPVVSIEAVSPSVATGDYIPFKVRADSMPASDLSIIASVSATKTGLFGARKTGQAEVSLTSMNYDEGADGRTEPLQHKNRTGIDDVVTIALPANSAYQLQEGAGSIRVNVVDRRNLPQVTIVPGNDIDAGGNATFSVGLTGASRTGDVRVNLRSSASKTADGTAFDGLIMGTPSEYLEFMPTDMPKTHTVATSSTVVDPGRVIAEVLPGAGYRLAPVSGDFNPNRREVNVQPLYPTVEFTVAESAVDEGEGIVVNVEVTLTGGDSATSASTPIAVDFSISESGGADFIAQSYESNGYTHSARQMDNNGAGNRFVLPTVQNATEESDGTVTIVLDDLAGYVVGSDSRAEVTVRDDEDPNLPIASIAGGDDIEEGDTGVFTVTVTAKGGVTGQGKTVSVTTSGANNFISSTHSAMGSVTLSQVDSTDTYQGEYTVPTDADTDVEADQVMVVTLAPVSSGSGYSVGTPASASVIVSDNDNTGTPVVTIAPVSSGTVSEADVSSTQSSGGQPAFIVTGTGTGADNLVVTLLISQEGNFLATGQTGEKTVTLTDDSTSINGTHKVVLVDDGLEEPDGRIFARIVADSAYSVGAMHKAEVTARNDDQEKLAGISASTDGSAFSQMPAVLDEGGSGFTVRVELTTGVGAGDPALPITLDSTVSPFNCLSAPVRSTVDIPSGGSMAAFTVNRRDDSFYRGDCRVAITVLEGSGYGLVAAEAMRTVTLIFNDNESMPTRTTLAITAQETTVSEEPIQPGVPRQVEFVISKFGAANAVSLDLVSTNGTAYSGGDGNRGRRDFEHVGKTLEFTANENFKTETVTINNDEVYEGSTPETFSLLLDDQYKTGDFVIAAGGRTATVSITDDEDPPVVSLEPTSPISLLEGISGSKPVPFTISLSRRSALPVTVTLNSADAASGTSATKGSDYTWTDGNYVIPAGVLEFALDEDAVNPPNIPGYLVVLGDEIDEPGDEGFRIVLQNTIVNGTKHATNDTVDVVIEDNQLPTVTVMSDASTHGVTQRHPFTFRVARTKSTTDDLVLQLSYSDEGSMVVTSASSTGPAQTVGTTPGAFRIPAGESHVDVTVLTTNPSGSTGDVTFSVEIVDEPENFNLSTNQTVLLKDSESATDAMPRVSVIAPAGPIRVEGTAAVTADFILRSHATPTSADIEVNYMLSTVGDFIDRTEHTTLKSEVTLSTSSEDTPLPITLANPTGISDNGRVVVTLLEGENYTLADPGSESADVAVSNKVFVSISGPAGGATLEGDSCVSPPYNRVGFNVNVNNPVPTGGMDVTWTVTGHQASDFVSTQEFTGEVMFSAGDTASQAIHLDILCDDANEPDESFAVTLSNITDTAGTAIASDMVDFETGGNSITHTIRNDDASVVKITPEISMEEGDSGDAKTFNFIVSMSDAISDSAVSLKWEFISGGTQPVDFMGDRFPGVSGGTAIAFPINGNDDLTIPITVTGDSDPEPDQSFVVQLTELTTLGGRVVFHNEDDMVVDTLTATGTILNDDFDPVRISTPAASATEADTGGTNSTVNFTVSADSQSSNYTVRWAVFATADTADHDAGADDFVDPDGNTQTANALIDGEVMFTTADGDGNNTPSTRQIMVEIAGDNIVEEDETFEIRLIAVEGAAFDSGDVDLSDAPGAVTATGTIRDNDLVVVSISGPLDVSSMPVDSTVEGDTPVNFTVSLNRLPHSNVTVVWGVTGSGPHPAAAADFLNSTLPANRELDFMTAGSTSAAAIVTIADDSTNEPHEDFTVSLVRVEDAGGNEITDGSVIVNTDSTLSSVTHTITNDEPAKVTISDAVMENEGNGSSTTAFGFTVSLSEAITVDSLDVTWTFDRGDTNAMDFMGNALPAPADHAIRFPAGTNADVMIPIAVMHDASAEKDEEFTISLTGLSIDDGRVVFVDSADNEVETLSITNTIQNDDPDPISIAVKPDTGVTITDGAFSKLESSANNTIPFTVTVAEDQTQDFTVTWAIFAKGANRANMDDFSDTDNTPATRVANSLADGTVVFGTATGNGGNGTNTGKTREFTITVIGDTDGEFDETYEVKLVGVAGDAATMELVALSSVATEIAVDGTIVDDDALEISIAGPDSGDTTLEGDSGDTDRNFTISIDNAPEENTTVKWELKGDADADDFKTGQTRQGEVTFMETGSRERTIPVEIQGDEDNEPDEEFTLEITGVEDASDEAVLANVAKVTVPSVAHTILNDDAAEVGLSGNLTRLEGARGDEVQFDYTVSLSDVIPNQSGNDPLTVTWTLDRGTAQAADFISTQELTDTVDFAAGDVNPKTFGITVAGDDVKEGDETFTVSLTTLSVTDGRVVFVDGNGMERETLTATGTILDDDGDAVTLAATTVASVAEDTAPADAVSYTVRVANAQASNFTVEWAVFATESSTDHDAVMADFIDASVNTVAGDSRLADGEVVFGTSMVQGGNGTDTGLTRAFAISFNDDSLPEHDESYEVRLVGLSGPAFTAGDVNLAPDDQVSVVGVIEDDDAILISILDPLDDSSMPYDSTVEGDTGVKDVVFRIRLNNEPAAGADVKVNWMISGAVDAQDFADGEVLTGSETFTNGGGTEKTVTLQIKGDVDNEQDETFSVVLSPPTDASDVAIDEQMVRLAVRSATHTITNDDPAVVTIADISKAENEGGSTTEFRFLVELSNPVSTPFTIDWRFVAGGANPANAMDFLNGRLPEGTDITGNTIDFGMDDSVAKEILVTVANDPDTEPDEEFRIELSNISETGGRVVFHDSDGMVANALIAKGTIENDDFVPVTLAVTDPNGAVRSETDANNGVEFAVGIATAQTRSFSVGWAVYPTETDTDDDAETADFVDDDPGNRTRGALADGVVEFSTETADGGTGTHTPRSVPFEVTIAGERDFEPDESYVVRLVSLTGAAVESGDVDYGTAAQISVVGTIEDDDLIEVAIANPVRDGSTASSTAEDMDGAATAVEFTVSVNKAPKEEINVLWSLAGSGANPAAVGGPESDFNSNQDQTGTVTFDPDDGADKTVTVTIADDDDNEAHESFAVSLAGLEDMNDTAVPAGGWAVPKTGMDSAVHTIINDEPAVVRLSEGVTLPESAVESDAGAFDLAVTLSKGIDEPLTVTWEFVPGTTNDMDFVGDELPEGGTVDFGMNDVAAKSIPIMVKNDLGAEADKTFTVRLTALSIDDGRVVFHDSNDMATAVLSATSTIQDDDFDRITLSAADAANPEGDANSTVTFMVSAAPQASNFTVGWAVYATADASDNDADEADFVDSSVSEANAFADGEVEFSTKDGIGNSTPNSRIFDITVAGDDVAELDESYEVRLISAKGPAVNAGLVNLAELAGRTVVGTIEDDDSVVISISGPAGSTSVEGTGGTSTVIEFMVTASNLPESGNDVMVTWTLSGDTMNDDFAGNQEFNSTLTFTSADASMSRTIPVSISQDAVNEPDEDFTIALSNLRNSSGPITGIAVRLGTSSVTHTITNDDAAYVELSGNLTMDEGGDGEQADFVYTVSLTDTLAERLEVTWTFDAGGIDAMDFVGGALPDPAATPIVFEQNSNDSRMIAVSVRGDEIPEDDQTFTLELTALSIADGRVSFRQADGTTAARLSAAGTVRNDDGDAVTLAAVGYASVLEDDSGPTAAYFTVSAAAQTRNFTVGWAVFATGTGAGHAVADDFIDDYITMTDAFADGKVEFSTAAADGGDGTYTPATRTFTVYIRGDRDAEPDETYEVRLVSVAGAAADVVALGAAGSVSVRGTIENDDFVPVTLAATTDASVMEGDSGATPVSFTVSAASQTENFTVGWAVFATGLGPGHAEESDFFDDGATNGTVEFSTATADGGDGTNTPATRTFMVNIMGDSDPEPNETYVVRLVSLTGPAVASGTVKRGSARSISVRSTILNDDFASVTLAATGDASVMEGDSGATPVSFTVSAAAQTGNFTVGWAVFATGTGNEHAVEEDFIDDDPTNKAVSALADGTVEFSTDGSAGGIGGSTPPTRTFTVNVMGDTDAELDEAYEVRLVSLTGAPATSGAVALGPDGMISVKGTIENDDEDPITLAVDTAADVMEGASGATPVTFTVSVPAQTANFTVGWEVVATGSGSGHAEDTDFIDDDPTSKAAGALADGIVEFSTAGNAGGTGTNTPPTQTFTVNIKGDDETEPDETYLVRLLPPTGAAVTANAVALGTAGSTSVIGTIANDDFAPVTLAAAANANNPETDADNAVSFTVSAAAQSANFTVGWAVFATGSDSGHANADDFMDDSVTEPNALADGTVRFSVDSADDGTGTTTPPTRTVMVNIAGDVDVEPDETYEVRLVSVSGAAAESGHVDLGTANEISVQGTIENDDAYAVTLADLAQFDLREGDSGSTPVTFSVSVEQPLEMNFTVGWAVFSTGTGAGHADADDFMDDSVSEPNALADGTVEFSTATADGGDGTNTQMRRTFTVSIMGDAEWEPDETYEVRLVSVTGAAANVDLGETGSISVIATIRNDDLAVETISIETDNPASIAEGEHSEVGFTISSTHPASEAVVHYSVSQSAYYIFGQAGGSVRLSSGTYTLMIPIIDNLVDETEESGTLTVTIRSLASDDFEIDDSKGSASVTIRDNDGPGTTGYSVAGSVIVEILNSQTTPVESNRAGAIQMPTVSIAAVTESVEEGGVAVFSLTSSAAVEDRLAVNVALVDVGNFIGGNSTRTASIAAGNDTGQLGVATINDRIAEDNGSITATITEGDGYEFDSGNSATVTVTDDEDRAARKSVVTEGNQEVFSRYIGSLGARSLDTATQRVTSAFSKGGRIKLEIGGNNSLPDLIRASGEAVNEGMESWQEVLGETSFEFGLFPEEGTSNPATVWGYGDFRDMSANGDGAGNLDGDMFTGHLGFDTLAGDGIVAGLAASVSRGELDYVLAGNEALSYTARTAGMHPYLGLEAADGSRLQVIAGYGVGEIELDQAGYDTEMLDSSYSSFGASGNRVLYSSDSLFLGGASELTLEGENWMASQFISSDNYVIGNMRTDARHLRIATVGTHKQVLESGAAISPSVSMGLREDGRKGESFLGMEMGGGIGLTNPYGYEISTRGEVLFAGTSQVQEWGMSGKLSYDSGRDNLGVQLSVTPEWGRSMLVADSVLWDDSVLVQDFDSSMHTSGARINAEIGYGLSVWEDLWLVRPYGGVLLSETQDDKYSLGAKLSIDSMIEFGLESSRILENNGALEDEFKLDGSIKW